jgi:putative Ca2+/H+ antiporter (TMEM165/GDT1 family)
MQPLFYSAFVGALAEIGDKSQFTLLVLSFRFRDATAAVVGGMVAAMVIALTPAALAGAWFAAHIDPTGLHWALALLLFGIVGFALLADHAGSLLIIRSGGVFITVLMTILLAEIGDKSQLASAVSSAGSGLLIPLTGTIVGASMINLPVAIAGPWLAERLVSKGLTLQWICRIIAVPFAGLAIMELSRSIAF